MNWNDAQEYVSWLSKKTGQTYHLLSEAEWEYVAHAGTTTHFNTGEQIKFLADIRVPKLSLPSTILLILDFGLSVTGDIARPSHK
jgi:hypothetical protein